jgi:alpha-galactosidase
VFQVMLEKFGLMPITSDSHFGEYIHWAYDVADHKGIVDFYRFYKGFLSQVQPKIELQLSERVVPIIEGIVTNSGYEEAAVNIPNCVDGRRIIDNLPDWIVVEAPATVDACGLHGVPLGDLPHGFAGLLTNQVAVHSLTADAVIHKSRALALQALLVDPIVGQYEGLEAMLDMMIEYQRPWLGYLQ